MAISTANPGTKIVFKDYTDGGPDIIYDVVVWMQHETDPEKVVGMVVLEGWNTLCPIEAIPVPPGYNIAGMAYCG